MPERFRAGKPAPNHAESKELREPAVLRIGPERWKEYKQIYMEAIEKEPVVFAGLMGLNAKAYRQFKPEEWQALLGNRLNKYREIQSKEDKRNPRIFLGFEVDGKLAAIVNFKIDQKAKTADINDLYVSAAQRGAHLGRKLMQAAFAEIKKYPGINKVELEVLNEPETAAARKLYHELGFREPPADPEVVQDDWGMGVDIKMEMQIK